MIRISKLAGLTAVSDGTGRRLGLVERAALSADGQDAEGLVLRLWGLGRAKRFVSFGNIALWGEVTITVKAVEKLSAEQKRREEVIGLAVLDTSGERLGWVTDALIEEESGCVLALEVSRGIVDDFTAGRIRVRDFTMRPGGVVAVMEEAGEGEDPSLADS